MGSKFFLITGGNGYIAKILSSFLENNGHTVFHLNRVKNNGVQSYAIFYKSKFVQKILTFADLSNFKINGIFHLATKYRSKYTLVDLKELEEASFKLTYQLAEVANKLNLILIIPGSYVQDIINLKSAEVQKYANVKNMAEQSFINFLELRYATTRQFESYGMFDTRNKFLNRIVDTIILEKELMNVNLDFTTDFMNVYDLCRAYYSIFKHLDKNKSAKNLKYIVSSGQWHKLRDLVDIIESITGLKLKTSHPRGSHEKLEIPESTLQLPAPPGWAPIYNVIDDLEVFVENRQIMLKKNQRRIDSYKDII